MQQETSQELVSRQRHYFVSLLVFVVLVGKADLSILQLFQPVVGDGDTMRVAAEIIQHAIGTAEWRFRVDYPFTVMERRQIAGEALGIGQWLQFAVVRTFVKEVRYDGTTGAVSLHLRGARPTMKIEFAVPV